MSETSGKMGLSLAQEILSHLGLANTVGAAGIVGIFFFITSTQGLGGGTGNRKGRAGPEAMPKAWPGHWGTGRLWYPHALTDCSLGHPQNLLELQYRQRCAEVAEGHCRPR